MEPLEEKQISCPYCGEFIDVLIDCTVEHQEYIEDCQVCCRPIVLRVSVSGSEEVLVEALHENEP